MSRRQYAEEQLENAVSKVKQNRLSITEAARRYGVPRKTVDNRVKGRTSAGCGPQQLLSPQYESVLVDYFTYMTSIGWTYSRKKARALIREMAIRLGKGDRVGKNGPTDSWFRAFLKRNPEMSEKNSSKDQENESSRTYADVVNNWFDLLDVSMKKNDVLYAPERIYSAAEIGFYGKDHPKGQQASRVKLTGNDHVTANLCVSGSGQFLPSMVVYKGVLPHDDYKSDLPQSWLVARSDSGDLDEELFYRWFAEIFVPHCHCERPVLLIVDIQDDLRLLSVKLIEKAIAEKIEILGLPGESTDLLEPFGVSLLEILMKQFAWRCQSLNIVDSNNVMPRAKLPLMLLQSIDRVSPYNIEHAFRVSGLVPLERENIDWKLVEEQSTSYEAETADSSKPDFSSSQPTLSPQPQCTCSCQWCCCNCHKIRCPTCHQILPDQHPLTTNLSPEHQQIVADDQSADGPSGKVNIELEKRQRTITDAEIQEESQNSDTKQRKKDERKLKQDAKKKAEEERRSKRAHLSRKVKRQ